MSGEFSRIERYFAPLASAEGLGLRDDAALLAPPPGRELVLTTDQMIEGIHFLGQDPPDLIARKLLRRNLSDLAAMGAEPLGYLLTIAIPKSTADQWLEGFAAGLKADQNEFGLRLFGGDSASNPLQSTFSATLIGHLAAGTALRRNGARAGDEIWVTGTIGDAALGLRARRGQLRDETGFLTARSMLPSPRLGLRLRGIATAAIDVSDGLIQDLGHICTASGLRAVIDSQLVPISAAAAACGDAMLEARLTEGDDYELVLAVPPGRSAALRSGCGALEVTKIGAFSQGAAEVEIRDRSGKTLRFTRPGWSHF